MPKQPPAPPKSVPIAGPLRAAALATAVEAVALAASAVGVAIYQASGHRPQSVADTWGVVAMAAVGSACLALVARGLFAGRRWARSPAVLTQLIVVPVGVTATANGAVLVGVPLLLSGLVGLVGLFAPSSIRRLTDE